MKNQEIRCLITRISGRPGSVGSRQLTQAVALLLQNASFPDRSLMAELYSQIARINGTTTQNVARTRARAAEACWESGDRKELERIAGRRLLEKPTPGELLFYLYHYLARNRESLSQAKLSTR